MTGILGGLIGSLIRAVAGVAGYFGGGFTTSTRVSTIDKFAFSADTRTTLGTGISADLNNLSGMENSGIAGYFGGGNDGSGLSGLVSTIDKFAFPADTRTTLATGLSIGRQSLAALSNKSVAGYFGGGFASDGSRSSTVDKFAFPADTRTTLGTGLSSARNQLMGISNPANAGYFAGGNTGFRVSTVDKFAFPGDTRTTLGTGLPTARESAASFTNPGINGYILGGSTGSATGTVVKITYSTDTLSNAGVTLSFTKVLLAGMSDTNIAGYAGGGADLNGSSPVSTIDKFAFPADTRTTLGTGLSSARGGLAAFANNGA